MIVWPGVPLRRGHLNPTLEVEKEPVMQRARERAFWKEETASAKAQG